MGDEPAVDRNGELPAAAGGTPAKTVPYGREPKYRMESELQHLREALEQDTLFYAHGEKVSRLEREFAKMHGVRFAVACSSGTAAVHAAMIATGLSPGDEVITAPITDMGALIPILFQGGVPVFADVDPRSYTLSSEAVEQAITSRTRAVLAVHLVGNACDMHALRGICDRNGLVLIEDCAQAWGCMYDGKPVGAWGRVGCFSLNEFKHISCGEGGLCATDDAETARRLRLATDKGYERDAAATERAPRFLATNSRMTELQAAVALVQLEKLEGQISRRRRWCMGLSEKLQSTEGITIPATVPKCDPSWWFYILRVVPEVLGAGAGAFADALQQEGLAAAQDYVRQCVYEYPVFTGHSAFSRGTHPYTARDYGKGLCPTAEAVLDTAVALPINAGYTERDLDETALGIRKVAKWLRDKSQ